MELELARMKAELTGGSPAGPQAIEQGRPQDAAPQQQDGPRINYNK